MYIWGRLGWYYICIMYIILVDIHTEMCKMKDFLCNSVYFFRTDIPKVELSRPTLSPLKSGNKFFGAKKIICPFYRDMSSFFPLKYYVN